MKYCYFTIYDNMHGKADYKFPIICSNMLYNSITHEHSIDTRTYAVGDTDGYDSLDDMVDVVSHKLGFNPIVVAGMKYRVNAPAIAQKWETKYIEAFRGQWEESNVDSAYIYPKASPNFVCGYNYLGTNAGNACKSTDSIWGGYRTPFDNLAGPTATIACSAIEINTQWPNEDYHVTHKLLIQKEEVIEDEEFDITKLQHDSGNNYFFTYATIVIFKNTNTQKWNFEITLTSYSADASDIITYVNGTEVKPKDPENPYEQPNDDPGGHGTDDDDSDDVDVPPLPNIDPILAGAINVYRCTTTDIKAFFEYLHSNAPGDSILKWFTNPSQGIVSCFMLPMPPHTITGEAIRILGTSATGTAGYLATPYDDWNMGSIYVDPTKYSDSFLCMAPYTKISIFLPFCGLHQLDTDEVMGHSVTLKYRIFNATGDCTAYVLIGSSVRYTFSGNAAAQVPISQTNWGDTYISAATTAATIAASGAKAAGSMATMTNGGGGAIASGIAQGLSTGIAGIQKPTVSRSGSLSGASGFLGGRKPYLIIESPIPIKISNMSSIAGYPAAKSATFGNLSGYNTVEHCHLTGIPATGPELDEIESLLKQGVIF